MGFKLKHVSHNDGTRMMSNRGRCQTADVTFEYTMGYGALLPAPERAMRISNNK
jgi:hypothetical protein